MKKIAVGLMVLMIMGSTVISYADGVVIPVSIKVEAFKKMMKEKGMNLYGGDEADGFVEDSGNKIKVITYKPVTMEQMDLMKESAFKAVRNG